METISVKTELIDGFYEVFMEDCGTYRKVFLDQDLTISKIEGASVEDVSKAVGVDSSKIDLLALFQSIRWDIGGKGVEVCIDYDYRIFIGGKAYSKVVVIVDWIEVSQFELLREDSEVPDEILWCEDNKAWITELVKKDKGFATFIFELYRMLHDEKQFYKLFDLIIRLSENPKILDITRSLYCVSGEGGDASAIRNRIHKLRVPLFIANNLKQERAIGGYFECDLEKYIINNFDNLFPDYKFINNQHKIVGVGVIDILAHDKKSKRPVIIEIKRRGFSPNRQLIAYGSQFDNPILVGVTEQEVSEKLDSVIYKIIKYPKYKFS